MGSSKNPGAASSPKGERRDSARAYGKGRALGVAWNKGAKLRPLSDQARARFLEGLTEGLTVTLAAEKAGRAHPRRFYELRNEDEEFAAQWQEALERGTQKLEEELRRRAVEGWEETAREYREGELVRETVTRRYSPALLIFMLKARRPEVYRDTNTMRLTGAEGGAVQIVVESCFDLEEPAAPLTLPGLAAPLALPPPSDAEDGEACTPGEGDARAPGGGGT
jgi:hypothetical protein